MKKTYFVILLFSVVRLFAQNLNNGQLEQLNYSSVDFARNQIENIEISKKSPWLAFFLSMFVPTTGQLYNGDYTKALIQATLFVGGLGLVAGTACVECGDYTPIQSTLFITGFGLAFSSYLWSIIDAPISANNHNARIKSTSGINLYNSEDNKYSIQINKLPIHEVYGLSLVVEL